MTSTPISFRNAGKYFLVTLALGSSVASTVVMAKLPVVAATPEAAAKAEEAKAKAAEAAKVANAQLAASQDKAANHWAAKVRAQGKEFKPTPIAVPAAAVPSTSAAPAAGVTPAPKK
jgi:hypothetical protein